MICKICHNDQGNTAYEAKEMMFGMGETFVYFQCAHCQCLQIAQPPPDLSKYYPDNYYSFNRLIVPHDGETWGAKRLNNVRNIYLSFSKGFFTKVGVLKGLIPLGFFNKRFEILPGIFLKKKSRILDVGCGEGGFLYALRSLGFTEVRGNDPYIHHDLQYDNGLKISKGPLDEGNTQYDLIMFHHSFEHVADPHKTLAMVKKVLSPDGVCLIRIPTVSSYAWERYRENWVGLDAPRHMFLYSLKAMNLLADECNLTVKKVEYDSYELQFWGSEQYKKGIPLFSEQSFAQNKRASIFSSKEMAQFRKESRRLNNARQGDQAAFFLTHKK